MKKTLILLSALAFLGHDTHAQVVYGDNEYSYVQSLYKGQPGSTTHSGDLSGQVMPAKYRLSGLGDNWFASVQGGRLIHRRPCLAHRLQRQDQDGP